MLFEFQKDLTLVSYVSRKNKCVILISTSHDDDKIDPETQKPDIILDYNKNKGGVDTVDQLCNTYSVARKTRRWPLAVFFSLLNIGGINAFVIHSEKNPQSPPQPRRIFLKNLSTLLMKCHLQQRLRIPQLPTHAKAIIRRLVENEGTERKDNCDPPPAKKIRGRCVLCGRQKNNNTTLKCSECFQFTCKSHMKDVKYTCESCAIHQKDEF